MGFLRLYRRLIAIPVAAIMMFVVLPYGAAQAAMVSTEQAVSASAAPKRTGAEARAHVLGILQRADVQAEMRALGVNPAEAIDRVNAMSDSEVKQVAGKIDESPAGGSVVGIVVGSLLAVFLILLLTDILCLTSVFPFTKCVSKN
jgi:glutamate mutase epsilon subunit